MGNIPVDKPATKKPKKAKATVTMPKAVLDILGHFAEYVWGTKPEYPETLTNLPTFVDKREAHEGKQADCTVTLGAVVMCLTNGKHVWTRADYRDLMLMDGSKPWSCAEAWSRATGAPVNSSGTTPAGEVHAVQGLAGLVDGAFGKGTTGHQWIEFNGKAWHLSRSGKTLTMAGKIPGYKLRKSVRIC